MIEHIEANHNPADGPSQMPDREQGYAQPERMPLRHRVHRQPKQ
jgi:hypothetical protein